MKSFLMLITLFICSACNTLTKDEAKGCYNYEPVCALYDTVKECTVNKDGCLSCACNPRPGSLYNPNQKR